MIKEQARQSQVHFSSKLFQKHPQQWQAYLRRKNQKEFEAKFKNEEDRWTPNPTQQVQEELGMSHEQNLKFNKIMYRYSVSNLLQSSFDRIEILKQRKKSLEYTHGCFTQEPAILDSSESGVQAKKILKFSME